MNSVAKPPKRGSKTQSAVFRIKVDLSCKTSMLFSFLAPTWIDNIKSWSGLSLTELTRKVEDRYQWRTIVHGVANPRNEDG